MGTSFSIDLPAVTIAEVRFGIERLPAGARRNRLDAWLTDDLPLRFEARLLPIDAQVGDCWGRIMARARGAGRTMGAMDGFIAASSERYDLVVVTRDVAGFAPVGTWSDD